MLKRRVKIKDEVWGREEIFSAWKTIKKVGKKEGKKFIKWLFLYQPDDDMDTILHIITVISWLIVGWALASGRYVR